MRNFFKTAVKTVTHFTILASARLKEAGPVSALKDHWMKLVAIGSVSAGVFDINVPAGLITFGVLFFGLEAIVGD